MALQTLTIRRPDDWHLHLRDGAMLDAVAPYSARQFARAIVMPNLDPPVTSVDAARAYRERIAAAAGGGFTPLMTCYLTDDADADEIARGFESGAWAACKLYPANATTNSARGVTDVRNIRGALERMAEIGMPLLVHGEVTDPDVDVFDREAVFIDRILAPLVTREIVYRLLSGAQHDRVISAATGAAVNYGACRSTCPEIQKAMKAIRIARTGGPEVLVVEGVVLHALQFAVHAQDGRLAPGSGICLNLSAFVVEKGDSGPAKEE